MNGIINVYKEKGYTSHDVVAKLRGILRQKKIGHTGTLDPQAEGVLPVCLGNATRLCDLLTDKTKEYEAVLRLGITTDTQDMTGTVLSEAPVEITEDDIINIMSTFKGKIMQVPPMYSALKVGGRKLVDLAREGIEVERKAREIEIYELEILEVNLPFVRFCVDCSKGTYIRTLCQDIGEKAGCGGAMESLLRTRVDRFGIADALTLDLIEQMRDGKKLDEILYPVDEVFLHLPAVTVKDEFRKVIDNGNSLYPHMYEPRVEFYTDTKKTPAQIRIYNGDGIFYGIYVFDPERRRFKPYKMFLDKEALKEKYGKEYF
nr:tRNA pseudouridine(55) synthase TruB [Lachnospiraceae bacterium]